MAKVGRAAHTASRNRVESVSASKTITIAESGELYGVSLDSASLTITLPASPEAGTNFTFVIAAGNGTYNLTVASGDSASFIGGVVFLNTGGSPASVAGSGTSLLCDSALPGSRIHVVSDGSYWMASGGIVSGDTPVFS